MGQDDTRMATTSGSNNIAKMASLAWDGSNHDEAKGVGTNRPVIVGFGATSLGYVLATRSVSKSRLVLLHIYLRQEIIVAMATQLTVEHLLTAELIDEQGFQ